MLLDSFCLRYGKLKRESIEMPFNDDEVTKALLDCCEDKSNKSDGMTMALVIYPHLVENVRRVFLLGNLWPTSTPLLLILYLRKLILPAYQFG